MLRVALEESVPPVELKSYGWFLKHLVTYHSHFPSQQLLWKYRYITYKLTHETVTLPVKADIIYSNY